jgi:tRNA (guanine-N7-)-methyltransferase
MAVHTAKRTLHPTRPDADPAPDADEPAAVTAPPNPVETPAPYRRAIRSFVVRAGRMTTAQERAWRELWPLWGVDEEGGPLDFAATFAREAPVTVEIGFGNGESLVALAADQPDRNFLGLEVHPPGVGHLLLRCEAERLSNVRVVCEDAVEVLRQRVADASVDEVLLYFPDPWPKKRHHKRRIVQAPFVELVASRLRIGGTFRMATDWQPYAEHMLATAAACLRLVNESPAGDYVARPDSRPITRFERRGQRLGHGVWDLAFRRV